MPYQKITRISPASHLTHVSNTHLYLPCQDFFQINKKPLVNGRRTSRKPYGYNMTNLKCLPLFKAGTRGIVINRSSRQIHPLFIECLHELGT